MDTSNTATLASENLNPFRVKPFSTSMKPPSAEDADFDNSIFASWARLLWCERCGARGIRKERKLGSNPGDAASHSRARRRSPVLTIARGTTRRSRMCRRCCRARPTAAGQWTVTLHGLSVNRKKVNWPSTMNEALPGKNVVHPDTNMMLPGAILCRGAESDRAADTDAEPRSLI
ncbi:hypothetical protein GGX14DRAFT_388732 [Mycena pura]|uniref:Uncharacterized protein n=1 Tax=Mycena pura TaxID=153505 RepID=A0AAD6YK88_9AGAR|nr:hypothetical protein GGX14DRAFT_388732 [Mycena pura]